MWQRYRDELIQARVMLTDACTALGDNEEALYLRQGTWMIDAASGCGPGKNVFMTVELASQAHRKADQLEMAADYMKQGELDDNVTLTVGIKSGSTAERSDPRVACF